MLLNCAPGCWRRGTSSRCSWARSRWGRASGAPWSRPYPLYSTGHFQVNLTSENQVLSVLSLCQSRKGYIFTRNSGSKSRRTTLLYCPRRQTLRFRSGRWGPWSGPRSSSRGRIRPRRRTRSCPRPDRPGLRFNTLKNMTKIILNIISKLDLQVPRWFWVNWIVSLGVCSRVPRASLCLHQESLDDVVERS